MPDPASRLEEIRFGYGPRAGQALASGGLDPDRVMAQLTARDKPAEAWTGPTLADRFVLIDDQIARRRAKLPPLTDPTYNLNTIRARDALAFIARPTAASCGFVERLVNLWSNRLTVASSPGVAILIPPLRDEAVRPHITGRFPDMLRAVLWQPAMLAYLNQNVSSGPNSSYGLRKGRGLNENLARELLELHSMGTGFTQADVTELARLLAGMQAAGNGPELDERRVEPGEKTILGDTYTTGIPEIDRLAETIAMRPETAHSVARMLARHFIADEPPADLVETLAQTYLQSGGHLPPMYRALLTHPAAHDQTLHKLRSPQDFMAASLRATGLSGDEEETPAFRKKGMRLGEVMARMGQPVFAARRPDGWPETAPGFLTPPMVAARLEWATDLARLTGERADPVAQAQHLLGDLGTPLLFGAVAGAEQRWEGLAVLLGSPDFMRR